MDEEKVNETETQAPPPADEPQPQGVGQEPPPMPRSRGQSIHIASEAMKTARSMIDAIVSKVEKLEIKDEHLSDLLSVAHECLAEGDDHLDYHIALAKNAKNSAVTLGALWSSMTVGLVMGAYTATPKQPDRPGIFTSILDSLSPDTKASAAGTLLQALPLVAQWLQDQQEQNAARVERRKAAEQAARGKPADPPPADAPPAAAEQT